MQFIEDELVRSSYSLSRWRADASIILALFNTLMHNGSHYGEPACKYGSNELRKLSQRTFNSSRLQPGSFPNPAEAPKASRRVFSWKSSGCPVARLGAAFRPREEIRRQVERAAAEPKIDPRPPSTGRDAQFLKVSLRNWKAVLIEEVNGLGSGKTRHGVRFS
jgi:hypothetical protein